MRPVSHGTQRRRLHALQGPDLWAGNVEVSADLAG